MNKDKFTKLVLENEHPNEEALLMLLDGELSAREAGDVRQHLETCWSCRAELEKIEETISLFVDFKRKVQTPLSPPPPGNWSGFNRLLADAGR